MTASQDRRSVQQLRELELVHHWERVIAPDGDGAIVERDLMPTWNALLDAVEALQEIANNDGFVTLLKNPAIARAALAAVEGRTEA